MIHVAIMRHQAKLPLSSDIYPLDAARTVATYTTYGVPLNSTCDPTVKGLLLGATAGSNNQHLSKCGPQPSALLTAYDMVLAEQPHLALVRCQDCSSLRVTCRQRQPPHHQIAEVRTICVKETIY